MLLIFYLVVQFQQMVELEEMLAADYQEVVLEVELGDQF